MIWDFIRATFYAFKTELVHRKKIQNNDPEF